MNEIEMPKYQCHKQVWALKIQAVNLNAQENSITLHFFDKAYAPKEITKEYFDKHKPRAGGYYVIYKGGYESFSPADAFEKGYTLIK